MEDILDEIEKPTLYTDKEIFAKLWTMPRSVFAFIHEKKYDKYVMALLVFAGISRAFGRAVEKNMGDDFGLIGVIAASVLLGGLLGWISYYLYAALLSWTGKWLDGKGDASSLIRIIAYALTPTVVGLLLLIPQIAIYGIELFKSDGDIYSGGIVSNLIFYGSILAEFILGLWTIVLVVIGVSVVQEFGIGKAILNVILPVLVIFVPILLLIWLVNGG